MITLKLKIKDKEIELTPTELEELYNELKLLFKEKEVGYPYYPPTPIEPLYPYNPTYPIIRCKEHTGTPINNMPINTC